jgi:hypothetical protein
VLIADLAIADWQLAIGNRRLAIADSAIGDWVIGD